MSKHQTDQHRPFGAVLALGLWLPLLTWGQGTSPLLQITTFEASLGQPLVMGFTDAGTGATHYQVEFTPEVGPGRSWEILEGALIVEQEAGTYAVLLGEPVLARGFYRVRALGGSGEVTATFSTTTLEVSEGGMTEPVVTFSAPYVGKLRYTISGTAMSGDYASLSGEIDVNGTTATIPVTLLEDRMISELRYLTLTLSAEAGYIVGPSASSIITIVDNDAAWRGAFESESGCFAFTLRINEENGAFDGSLQSEGLGFFPATEVPAVIVFTEETFGALVDPVDVGPESTSLGEPMRLRLTLTAIEGRTNQSVSADQVLGEATLVTEVPGRPLLNLTNEGSFFLLRPPTRPHTNKVELLTNPQP